MKSGIKLYLPIIGALLLSACTVSPNSFIVPQAKQHIKSTDVFIEVGQQEIIAEIDRSQVAVAGGGGLLLALIDVAIDNSRANDAEELIVPIRDALIDVDFAAEFNANLASELTKFSWLNVNHIDLKREVEPYSVAQHYKQTEADAVLVVNAGYALSADFSTLKGQANILLLPKAEKLRQYAEDPTSNDARKIPWHIDNNLSRDRVVTQTRIEKTTQDKEFNSQIISSKPAQLISRVKLLAKQLAQQVGYSLAKQREKN